MGREMLERWADNLGERNAIADFWGWVSERLDADVWFSDIDVDAELDAYHKIDQAQLERERRQLLESCVKT